MEVLSSVRGCVLDVLDGALDDAKDLPLTPELRIKSAVSIRRWAHSLCKLGSIPKTELPTRKSVESISQNGTMMRPCTPRKHVVLVK